MIVFWIIAAVLLGVEVIGLMLARRRRALDAAEDRETTRNVAMFRAIGQLPDAPEVALLGRKPHRPRPR